MEEARGDAGLRTAVAIGCASAALLVGCGDDEGDKGSANTTTAAPAAQRPGQGAKGSEQAEYERAFAKVIEEVGATLTFKDLQQGDAAENPSPEQMATAVARMQGAFRNIAARVDRLRPPAEVADAHRKYVRGLVLVANDMQRTVDLLRARDPTTVTALQQGDFSRAAQPEHTQIVGEATAEFAAHGYEIADLPDPSGRTP